jgi:hypothetical protein
MDEPVTGLLFPPKGEDFYFLWGVKISHKVNRILYLVDTGRSFFEDKAAWVCS